MPKIYTTPKQKAAVDNIIKQSLSWKKIKLWKAIEEAWFSKQVARIPQAVLQATWTKQYLEMAGLTEPQFAFYLAEDLQNKPQNRLGELRLLADVLWLTKQTVDVNLQKTDEAMATLRNIIDWEVVYDWEESWE